MAPEMLSGAIFVAADIRRTRREVAEINEESTRRVRKQAAQWDVEIARRIWNSRRGIGLVCRAPGGLRKTVWSYRAWQDWKLILRARRDGFTISRGVDDSIERGSPYRQRVRIWRAGSNASAAAHHRTYTLAYHKAKRRLESEEAERTDAAS